MALSCTHVPRHPERSRLVKLSRLIVALAFSAVAAPAAAQMRLDLNIPENRLRVLDGDSVVRTYRVSVGTPGHDTPDGSFTVERAEWNPSWRPPTNREWARGKEFMPPGPNNPMGRVKLFFMPLYYIHGTPDSASIGTPASHGCVRMRNRDVVELARLLHQHAQPTVAPSEIDGILRRATTTRWSSFRAPVPLVIRYDPVVVENDEVRVYPDFYNRSRVHSEGVIQALLAAGYEANSIDRAQIRALLQRARQARGPVTARLSEAFTGLRRSSAAADR